MKKIITWLKESNRYKHLLGGVLLGVLALGWLNALFIGTAVGAAMEYKDYKYVKSFDPYDFACTVVGAVVGYGVRYLLM